MEWGRGKCTRGAAIEMNWWWFGGVSVDTTILNTFLSAPACTDIVYSKELERDVTTSAMAKAILHLKNFGIYSFIEHDRFKFLCTCTCHVHAMCKMLLF